MTEDNFNIRDYMKSKGVRNPTAKRKEPLWKGPCVDGVTKSLLERFLVDRERFRLYTIEGLVGGDRFSHRQEYGNMWHICEECYAAGWDGRSPLKDLEDHARDLCRRYPNDQSEVEKWFRVCLVQFPIYLQWQRSHYEDVEYLLQEQPFNVPYHLPSGRTVLLRGKWDAIGLRSRDGKEDRRHLWLQENKTKGDVDQRALTQQLKFDLQTMLYLVALRIYQIQPKQHRLRGEGLLRSVPIAGVVYNVVRRPLSGGRHTIRQHQPSAKNPRGESTESFYTRLGEAISGEPEYFFMRWAVEVSNKDVEVFRTQCLTPLLEDLCNWYQHVTSCGDPFCVEAPYSTQQLLRFTAPHWRMPYGVYNPIQEGLGTDYDNYLATGSMVGLRRVEDLFPELR